MKRFFTLLTFLFCVLSVWAQKKLPEIKKVIISDSIEVIVNQSEKNTCEYSGKNLSVKVKKGVLTVVRLEKVRMDVDGDVKKTSSNVQPKIILNLNSNLEHFSAYHNAKVEFNNFSPKRIIINLETNSVGLGSIKSTAFGLNLKSGAESYFNGNFRSTKITVDSSKAVFEKYVSENSEFIVSGGSLMTIEGKTNNLKLSVSGLSRFEGLRLSSNYSLAEISGNSDVFFNTAKTLNISAKNRSHIVLTGSPKILDEKIEKGCKFSKR